MRVEGALNYRSFIEPIKGSKLKQVAAFDADHRLIYLW